MSRVSMLYSADAMEVGGYTEPSRTALLHSSSQLPHVPLTANGRLRPEDLVYVLDEAFLHRFDHIPSLTAAVQVLRLAARDYTNVFDTWKHAPDPSAPLPSRTSPPNIHDVLEALHSLRNHSESRPSLDLHANLQAMLNQKQASPEQTTLFHSLLRRYPFLTMSVVESVSSFAEQVPDSTASAPAPAEHRIAMRSAEDEASKILDRLDEVERRHQASKLKLGETASKKHVLLSSVLSLLSTATAFVILYYKHANTNPSEE